MLLSLFAVVVFVVVSVLHGLFIIIAALAFLIIYIHKAINKYLFIFCNNVYLDRKVKVTPLVAMQVSWLVGHAQRVPLYSSLQIQRPQTHCPRASPTSHPQYSSTLTSYNCLEYTQRNKRQRKSVTARRPPCYKEIDHAMLQ